MSHGAIMRLCAEVARAQLDREVPEREADRWCGMVTAAKNEHDAIRSQRDRLRDALLAPDQSSLSTQRE